MPARFWLKYCQKQGKIILHKAGQIIFRPVWNYLPGTVSPESLNLVIIPTKICNANCIFCAYQFLPKSERIHMSDAVFLRIIKNIKKLGILSVILSSNAGEPLVAPNLLEKIRELRNAGVRKIQLTTNAILLDSIGIDQFLENGPDIINISTTAFDANMYQRLFRSDQFQRMRSNVINLLTANRRRRKPRYITLGIRPDIAKKDVLAIPQMRAIISLADEVEITEGYGDWLGLIKNSMLTGAMRVEQPKPISNRPCQVLITCPAIHPNGDILACACRNIQNDPDMYIGNILETDLGTALSKIKDIAQRWQKRKLPRTCYLCTMYGEPSYYWPGYLGRQLYRRFTRLGLKLRLIAHN